MQPEKLQVSHDGPLGASDVACADRRVRRPSSALRLCLDLAPPTVAHSHHSRNPTYCASTVIPTADPISPPVRPRRHSDLPRCACRSSPHQHAPSCKTRSPRCARSACKNGPRSSRRSSSPGSRRAHGRSERRTGPAGGGVGSTRCIKIPSFSRTRLDPGGWDLGLGRGGADCRASSRRVEVCRLPRKVSGPRCVGWASGSSRDQLITRLPRARDI